MNKLSTPKAQLIICLAWFIGAITVLAIAEPMFTFSKSVESREAAEAAAQLASIAAVVHGGLSIIVLFTKLWWIAIPAIAIPFLGAWAQQSGAAGDTILFFTYLAGTLLVFLIMLITLIVKQSKSQ